MAAHRALLLALALALAPAPLSSAPPPPTPPALLMRRVALREPRAVCNDGSRAACFFRNCSANWDSHSGFDYCANITDDWLLVFGADAPAALLNSSGGAPAAPDAAGAFCYSAQSCAARDAALRSAASLPARAFPGGLVSPFAEQNANLYKAHTVVVPYCSSDLFAGNGSLGGGGAVDGAASVAFAGRAVLEATLAQLFEAGGVPAGEGPTMAHADRVVLVGGAGVMARLDELAALLLAFKRAATRNASATLAVFGVCDGCLLLDVAPPLIEPPACATDADCPPRAALPLLHAVAQLARPQWCAEPEATVWRCYEAAQLSSALAHAATPVLVQQALFDERQLRAGGVVDPARPTGAERAWAEAAFAPATRAALALHNCEWAVMGRQRTQESAASACVARNLGLTPAPTPLALYLLSSRRLIFGRMRGSARARHGWRGLLPRARALRGCHRQQAECLAEPGATLLPRVRGRRRTRAHALRTLRGRLLRLWLWRLLCCLLRDCKVMVALLAAARRILSFSAPCK